MQYLLGANLITINFHTVTEAHSQYAYGQLGIRMCVQVVHCFILAHNFLFCLKHQQLSKSTMI